VRRSTAPGAVAALLALACQGPALPGSELPERAIALHYYDVETLRRRTEAIADAQPSPMRQPRAGVARMEDLSFFVDRLLGVQIGEEETSLERRFPGRLAWLDPRTGKVELMPGARPGAMPRAESPDGERLIFSQASGGYRQLFELNRSSGEVRRLTRGRAVHADGCYGPEGRYVLASAWVEEERPVSYIELTEPGGVRPRRISAGPSDYATACAPDGTAVAWVAVDDRGRDVLMSRMPVVDGVVRRLGPGRTPAFSPDSQWIVYSAQVKGRWSLHRIRPDGSGRRAIGRGTFDELEPSFSPDGRLLVYVSDDGFDQRIYVRRFDGTGDRVLLDAGGGTSPVW
jgi:Tol biopolymer transport system component